MSSSVTRPFGHRPSFAALTMRLRSITLPILPGLKTSGAGFRAREACGNCNLFQSVSRGLASLFSGSGPRSQFHQHHAGTDHRDPGAHQLD